MDLFCKRCGATISPKTGDCNRCAGLVKTRKETDKGSKNIQRGKNAHGIFPFDEIRKGQKQLMEDSEEVFKTGKTLIAHAPTGIGKTAAVLTSALKACGKRKVFFLTSKQSQHHIAVETIKCMPPNIKGVDVISKQHMCPREESMLPYPVFEKFCNDTGQSHCNLFNKSMNKAVSQIQRDTLHVEEVVELCSRYNVCPHKSALVAGREADVIVCDYNYMFSDMRDRILELLELELSDCLLIVDEAHNLPDRVRSHLEDHMELELLRETFRLLDGSHPDLAAFVKRLAIEFDQIKGKDRLIDKELIDDKIDVALRGGFGRFESLEDMMPELEEAARNTLEKDPAASSPMRLYSFLTTWSTEGEKVFRAFDHEKVSVRVGLLDPSMLTADVFLGVHSSVLMSGTLYPGEMYADLLGITDPLIRTYSSPFPKENRKVVSLDHLTTSYRERGMPMYQAYANAIADIANNVPGNAAVFFPSYSLMNTVYDRLEMVHLKKDIIVEDRRYTKRDREEIVNELHRFRNKLLMGVQGGSLSEGVDYKNNILCSVMIAGIPFPPPSPDVKALEDYYSKKFDSRKGYEYSRVFPAMNRVLQAAGRCIRGRSDRGIIVLMDKRFNQAHYRKFLPDDFEFESSEDIQKECKSFFG